MFTSDADLHRVDWPLLQNGAVNLFWKPEILDEARQSLAGLGYDIARVSCSEGLLGFCEQLSRALKWEEQFGYGPWKGNLDALNDGMSGYPFGPSGRSALVLEGFHHLVSEGADRARGVLDIVESSARDHLLWGKTLIALVQTDDPRYSCHGLGCRGTNWNPRECLDTNRVA